MEITKLAPCIIALVGLPLTGKSTLGRALEKSSNALLCDVDVSRKALHLEGDKDNIRGSEAYEKQAMLNAYILNHKKAKEALEKNIPVILTATYSRPVYHEMLKKLSEETHTPLIVFLLESTDKKAKVRVEKRAAEGSNSNLQSFTDYLGVKMRYQCITDVELLKLDATKSIGELVELVLRNLRKYIIN